MFSHSMSLNYQQRIKKWKASKFRRVSVVVRCSRPATILDAAI